MGVAQILRHFVDRHHGGALFGKRAFLAGLRLEPRQLIHRMAQPVRFAPRLFDARAMDRHRLLGGAPRRPCPVDCRGILLEPRIGIEQPPVCRDIDKRAFIMLAMDLDERAAQRLQYLHAHRLVVDESARATVRQLHATQDQAVLGADAVFGKQRERRMLRLDVECRGHLPLLGALAHQARVAAAAERKRESIEQDRFAGAGLAGEHREARRIINVEPFDQNDVADREAGEHATAIAKYRASCPALCRASTSSFSAPKTSMAGPARAESGIKADARCVLWPAGGTRPAMTMPTEMSERLAESK